MTLGTERLDEILVIQVIYSYALVECITMDERDVFDETGYNPLQDGSLCLWSLIFHD